MSSKYKRKVVAPKKPKKECENILGPVSIHILDHKLDGSRIVLLGDIHKIDPKCLGKKQPCGTIIYNYLDSVFRNYDQKEFLDFFIEEEFDPLFRPEMDFKQNYLLSLRSYFHNCLQKQKSNCIYPKNIRFHYSDVRQGVIHTSLDEKTKDVVTQLQKIQELWDNKRGVTNKDIRLVETLLTKFKQKDVDWFFRFSKIDKQLKHISDKRYEQLFRMYLTDRMIHLEVLAEMIQERFNEFQSLFKKQKKLSDNEMRFEFLGIYESIIAYLVQSLFDIYTLSRMVRFNMKRVIIYAGELHIDIMRDFLVEHMGFKQTLVYNSNKENKNFQCIPRKFIGEPWFS